jgi:hypothetical protein
MMIIQQMTMYPIIFILLLIQVINHIILGMACFLSEEFIINMLLTGGIYLIRKLLFYTCFI